MAKIPYTEFPHIVEAIVDAAPATALPALRQVCRSFHIRVDERIDSDIAILQFSGTGQSSRLCRVWKPEWRGRLDVRCLDFYGSSPVYFNKVLVSDPAVGRPKSAFPRVRAARIIGDCSVLGEEPDKLAQHFPLIIVPRLSYRHYSPEQLHLPSGCPQAVWATSAKPSDIHWSVELANLPQLHPCSGHGLGLSLTVCILDTPDSRDAAVYESAPPMLRRLAEAFVESYRRNVLNPLNFQLTLVGLEAWRDNVATEHAWEDAMYLMILNTVYGVLSQGRGSRAFVVYPVAQEFMDSVRIVGLSDWKEELYDGEWELVESAYWEHKGWVERQMALLPWGIVQTISARRSSYAHTCLVILVMQAVRKRTDTFEVVTVCAELLHQVDSPLVAPSEIVATVAKRRGLRFRCVFVDA